MLALLFILTRAKEVVKRGVFMLAWTRLVLPVLIITGIDMN